MRRSFKFCISVILIMVLALSFTACSSAGFSEFGNMYNEIYQDSLDQMEEAYAEYAEALEEMDGLIPEMDPQEWSETSPKVRRIQLRHQYQQPNIPPQRKPSLRMNCPQILPFPYTLST